jgi:two-component system chemotaxis response regulator CheY
VEVQRAVRREDPVELAQRRRVVGKVLQDLGREDAVEGGKMLMAAPPDLLLLDIRMPHMGGDEFLALLRGEAQFKDLKVIALSSIQNSGLMMKVTDIGVCDFLHKPVNKDALLAAVKKALGR